MVFLEKMRRFFRIFPVISASKSMKMAKIESMVKHSISEILTVVMCGVNAGERNGHILKTWLDF